jgi:N6-adenosine-specific RNA methylase IME4
MSDLIPAAHNPVLVKLEQARFALAEARDLNAAKKVRDVAKAAADLLKQQRLGEEAVQDALELKLSAERRMGEFLAANVRPGNPQLFRRETIGRLPEGVSRAQSHRWQKVAALPEEVFDGYLAECRAKREEATTAGCLRLERELGQERKRNDLAARSIELVELRGLYPVILADPPWQYEHCRTTNREIENHYPTMPLAEICALAEKGKVPAAEDAILFLWSPSPKRREAEQVMEAWGFAYRTDMIWVKDRPGMGYWVRQMHEALLIGRRGNFPTPAEADRPNSVIVAPRGRHSEKPEVVYQIIERMCPGLPKFELFQRTPRPGWDGYGNEVADSARQPDSEAGEQPTHRAG